MQYVQQRHQDQKCTLRNDFKSNVKQPHHARQHYRGQLGRDIQPQRPHCHAIALRGLVQARAGQVSLDQGYRARLGASVVLIPLSSITCHEQTTASSRLTRQDKKQQAFGTYVNIFRATPTSIFEYVRDSYFIQSTKPQPAQQCYNMVTKRLTSRASGCTARRGVGAGVWSLSSSSLIKNSYQN